MRMRHRHFSNSFPRFGIDQHDTNHTPPEHSYFPPGRAGAPENAPFVDHMSRSGGPHSVPHHNLDINRPNEYPPTPSNITMEIQPFAPFPPPPITENRPLPPGSSHIHYTNYNNIPNTHDIEPNHPTNTRPLKRKRSGSLNSLYTTGSSSSSSQIPIEKPALDYRSTLTINGPDSSRNVRRRYSHDDMDPTIPTTHFYQSTRHPPAPLPHYPAPSHIRLSPPTESYHQFHIGSSSDPVFNTTSQNNYGPQGHHGNYYRRGQSSYGNGSRYSNYTHGGSSSTNGMRTPPENFPCRNSPRHCSPGGWRVNYRSGRPRLAVERFHSVLDVPESHDRIGHGSMMMVDRASFYGNNSRNFSDQYRDLRLDTDNMSYEELLSLEERIGNVNTGLSEDSMSKCLKEKVYYSSDQNHEEISCPICLEEYENGDNVGRMEKCGHGYHVECIKKWLLMKKLCPICKTEYSDQERREG